MRERKVTALAPVLGTVLTYGSVLLAAAPSLAQDLELPARWRANATNMSNVSGGRPRIARIEIAVNRWSDEEERTILIDALKEGGRRSLPDALSGKDLVGTVREVSQIAERLTFSRRIVHEDGQQILLATDRDIQFAEQMRSDRTLDYNVTLIVLNLDLEGNGDGQLMIGTELTWDEDAERVTVRHFASQPIQLTNVRLR